MWHYVDIHDQFVCLTSGLHSQMDLLLEPFCNQPLAPAKRYYFTVLHVLFSVNKLHRSTGTDPRMDVWFSDSQTEHSSALSPSCCPISVYGELAEVELPVYTFHLQH